jgi:MerR family transcriptional regulator, thiopeptide resistance regulator
MSASHDNAPRAPRPRGEPGGSVTVGRVAELAGVTVRTLHHYDEIGLLSPGGRTSVGYRRYSGEDLERLQQILFYRELGFALEEIATILDDPRAGAAAHLRRQHRLLIKRIERLQAMVVAVEFAMEAQQVGISLTPEERFEVFGDVDPEEYAEEAEQRWGGTEAYRQSQRRTASYTKEDWKRVTAEQGAVARRLAEAFTAGLAPDSAQAMDLAEQHRRHITRNFYDCSYETHRGLADMYVADPRFTQHYENYAPGLAQFVRDAIHANADRADPDADAAQ